MRQCLFFFQQRESPSWGSNFCRVEKSEFWDAQKRLLGSLNKFSNTCFQLLLQKKAHRVWIPTNGRGRWNGLTHWLDLKGSRGPSNCLVLFTELLLEISPYPLCPPPLLVLHPRTHPQPLPNANLSHGTPLWQAWSAHAPHPSSNSITAKFPKLGFRQQS